MTSDSTNTSTRKLSGYVSHEKGGWPPLKDAFISVRRATGSSGDPGVVVASTCFQISPRRHVWAEVSVLRCTQDLQDLLWEDELLSKPTRQSANFRVGVRFTGIRSFSTWRSAPKEPMLPPRGPLPHGLPSVPPSRVNDSDDQMESGASQRNVVACFHEHPTALAWSPSSHSLSLREVSMLSPFSVHSVAPQTRSIRGTADAQVQTTPLPFVAVVVPDRQMPQPTLRRNSSSASSSSDGRCQQQQQLLQNHSQTRVNVTGMPTSWTVGDAQWNPTALLANPDRHLDGLWRVREPDVNPWLQRLTIRGPIIVDGLGE